jgi:uncharacterized protein YcfL
MKKAFFLSIFAVALASCNNAVESTEVTLVDSTEVVVDSVLTDSVIIDTMETVD